MASTLDLRQLSVDRAKPGTASARPPRKLISRYVLPICVVLGFAVVIAWAIRDSFLPSKAVTVVPVIVSRAELQQAGMPLFRAAGWIEPRPTPVLVTALAEGVVDRLLVVEGQEVTSGQELAKLIDADARITLGQAEAELQLRKSEVESARAALVAATTTLDKPVHLQAALAEVESAHAKAKRELGNLPYLLRAAEARLQLARRSEERKKQVGEAIAKLTLEQAQSELAEAMAAAEELAARRPTLEQELSALQRKQQALATQLELKTEETRRVTEAHAAVSAAEARLKQGELALEAARLRLSRMTVTAPIAGRVLALHAQPGKRLVGLDSASPVDSSTVVSLYDPKMLQVRADVRLEDIPNVQTGQHVRIETAALSGGLDGAVLTATSVADVQKNTLQVKVAITDPPAVIKPDMLVQVTFMAPEQVPTSSEPSVEPLRMLIPKQLVENSGNDNSVWVADRVNGVAHRQTVTLGNAFKGELVEVTEGVTSMDRLISGGRETLNEGDRIHIVGEDANLGVTAER